MSNRYIKSSLLSESKIREIIKLFCLDIEAAKVAQFTGVSRQSINKIFKALRMRIMEICEDASPFENGEVELDESYFGQGVYVGLEGVELRARRLSLVCSNEVEKSTPK